MSICNSGPGYKMGMYVESQYNESQGTLKILYIYIYIYIYI